LIQRYLKWEPSTPLRIGLEKTYAWIFDQYQARESGSGSFIREAAIV
jgi:GDP-D-mannose 3', 5'-epimerase